MLTLPALPAEKSDIKHYRWINNDDVITGLPPLPNYSHHKPQGKLDSSGQSFVRQFDALGYEPNCHLEGVRLLRLEVAQRRVERLERGAAVRRVEAAA